MGNGVDFDVVKKDGKSVAHADEADVNALSEEAAKKVKDQLGVKALDLDSLAESLKPKIVDPEVGIEKEIEEKVSPIDQAKKEKSLHRYTIVVPNKGEESYVNIGEKNDARGIPNVGVSVKTVTHIGLQTTGKPTTMAVLGGPWKAEAKGDWSPKTALTKSNGFAMVTVGNSWLDSKGQMSIIAHDGEAHLRSIASYVRVQADHGKLELASHDYMTLGSQKTIQICADPAMTFQTDEDTEYGKPYADEFGHKIESPALKDYMTYGDFASSLYSLGMGAKKAWKESKDKERSWYAKANDWAKVLVDGAKLVGTAYRFADKKAPGQVKITADTYASLTGRSAASVYGTYSASVTSPVSASLLGGTAGVKGLVWASIFGGAGASMKTIGGTCSVGSDFGNVSVSADAGKAKMKGKAGVSIASEEVTEVKSDKELFATGKVSSKLTAGDGDGMGILAKNDEIYLGMASNVGKSAAAKDEKYFISLHKTNGIKIQAETEASSSVHISKDHMYFKSKQFIFNGKQVNIKGKKVNIGT